MSETKCLTPGLDRKLIGMLFGDSPIEPRDRTMQEVRATTATLLPSQGTNIFDVQTLLGHERAHDDHAQQIYNNRVRQTRDSASHRIAF